MNSLINTYLIVTFIVLHFNASLISSQCDVGWVSYEDTKCLKAIVSQTMMSWNEFNNTCTNEFGGTLASIHSKAENKFIFNSFLQPNDILGSNMCVGAKRKFKNEFIWIDGTPFNFTNWGQQIVQPDGDGDCMEMWSTSYSSERFIPNDKGRWNDFGCTVPHRRIALCQKNINTAVVCNRLVKEHKKLKAKLQSLYCEFE